MRIIIAGSRTFSDYEYLKKETEEIIKENMGLFPQEIFIISGTASGADTLGEKFCKENSYNLVRFPAEWETLGKKAGYVRNKEMAKYANKDTVSILIAFWDGKSRGTKHMINIARKEKLKIYIKNVG